LPECQGQGVAKALILESLPLVKQQLAEQDSVLKHVLVTIDDSQKRWRHYSIIALQIPDMKQAVLMLTDQK